MLRIWTVVNSQNHVVSAASIVRILRSVEMYYQVSALNLLKHVAFTLGNGDNAYSLVEMYYTDSEKNVLSKS